jgi:membrane protease YdiL (CAAX protease family)
MVRGNMTNLLGKELKNIYSFGKGNYGEMVVMSSATLFVTLDRYYPVGPQWLGSLVYFAILPVLTVVVLLRRNPLDFGFRFGNWRIWGIHVAIAFLVGLPILYAASRSSSLKAYYTIEALDLLTYSLEMIATLFAWEFLFRGFLLFGLREKTRELSILIQMVPFVLLHFGKPGIETLSTILTGVYFGYVAYRGNSYWPAFIIHLFINVSFVVFVNLLNAG